MSRYFFKIFLFAFFSEEQSELKINNVEEPNQHSEEKPTNQVEEDTCENNDAENGETNGEVTNEWFYVKIVSWEHEY